MHMQINCCEHTESKRWIDENLLTWEVVDNSEYYHETGGTVVALTSFGKIMGFLESDGDDTFVLLCVAKAMASYFTVMKLLPEYAKGGLHGESKVHEADEA